MIYSDSEIAKYKGLSPKDLTDNGICPTCFNKCSNNSVYGDDSQLKFYEDDDIECLFVANPRSPGHTIISTQKHYHDMTEAPVKLNEKIIRFAQELMIIINKTFGSERTYLCTMSDGPMNHYHIQLIPRYSYEKRGSTNFTKERKPYIFDKNKFTTVKKQITEFAKRDNK